MSVGMKGKRQSSSNLISPHQRFSLLARGASQRFVVSYKNELTRKKRTSGKVRNNRQSISPSFNTLRGRNVSGSPRLAFAEEAPAPFLRVPLPGKRSARLAHSCDPLDSAGNSPLGEVGCLFLWGIKHPTICTNSAVDDSDHLRP